MSDQLELDWLVQERPQPLPLDSATTARVRAELLDGRGRRRSATARGRLHRGALGLGMGGATLGGIAAAIALLASGGGAPATGLATATHHSRLPVQGPLTHLSLKLADQTQAVGDATLVLRRQTYPHSPEIDGADLYADNGNYYYSPVESGLPAMIKANETVNFGSSDQEQRDIAAAKAALSGPIDAARQQMSVANFDPNVKQHKAVTPFGAGPAATAELRQKEAQAERQAKADNLKSLISQEDGMIWDNGMDALLAGAGDPQVRAGVLKLFSTVPQIAVTSGTLDGQATLDLTASLLSSNSGTYEEQLILNANTGVPMQMIGGNRGQAPTVTTYYTITRTTVAAVEDSTAG